MIGLIALTVTVAVSRMKEGGGGVYGYTAHAADILNETLF